MTPVQPRPGIIYFCPVCGAEVVVVGGTPSAFHPRCCNRDMVPKKQMAVIYTCPVCGSQIMAVSRGQGEFTPRCCNRDMISRAA